MELKPVGGQAPVCETAGDPTDSCWSWSWCALLLVACPQLRQCRQTAAGVGHGVLCYSQHVHSSVIVIRQLLELVMVCFATRSMSTPRSMSSDSCWSWSWCALLLVACPQLSQCHQTAAGVGHGVLCYW